jgi:carboxymethylenebutenolidase
MTLHTETLRYGAHGEHTAYVARNALMPGPAPAILVFQEAWGVDEHIEDVTRRFAQAGYVAIAPDMFVKDGKRPAPLTKERLAEVLTFVNAMPMGTAFDPVKRKEALAQRDHEFAYRVEETLGAVMGSIGNMGGHVATLVASAKFARDFVASRGQPVGAVGFCMGGALASLLACHDPELRGAVSFYGSPPPDDKIAGIRCPVVSFLGSKDERLMAALPGFVEKMRAAGKQLESHVYEGAEHAFFNDARPSFDLKATRDSYARTLSFFGTVLA